MTEKRIRRGSFKSVPDLIKAIEGYINHNNQKPQIFTWTASVEKIMRKIAKWNEVLGAPH